MMRKTVKSKFLQVLEENDDVHPQSVNWQVLVIDAMVLIQCMKTPAITFGELAHYTFHNIHEKLW